MNENKKEISKAKPRDVREEMLTDDQMGLCSIDEKYKEDGYIYRIVDTTRMGNVNYHLRLGYEVVENPDMKIGDNKLTNTGSLGASVEFELGLGEKSVKGILMRTPQDLYDRRKEREAQKNAENFGAQLSSANIGKSYGEIRVGNAIISKK